MHQPAVSKIVNLKHNRITFNCFRKRFSETVSIYFGPTEIFPMNINMSFIHVLFLVAKNQIEHMVSLCV